MSDKFERLAEGNMSFTQTRLLACSDKEDDNMIREIHKQIFSSLLISRELFMDEMAILLARQQLSDYSMETDYFEKKYGMNFEAFDSRFRSREASYEKENDWMDWKFAAESRDHWQNILRQTGYDS